MTEAERIQLNKYLDVLANGNAEILDAIYFLVGRQMLAVARGITGNAADAEDVLQDSFIKIAENINSFGRGTNGYAWIMKIARNTALDYIRKRGRRAEENIDGFFSLSSADYDEEKLSNAILVEQAVMKLSPAERKIIYYSYYLGMTVREAAKNAGLSKSTAQRLLSSAEEKLKTLLSGGTKPNNETLL